MLIFLFAIAVYALESWVQLFHLLNLIWVGLFVLILASDADKGNFEVIELSLLVCFFQAAVGFLCELTLLDFADAC